MNIDVYNLNKEKVSETELREDIFNVPIKTHVLHQVVVAQLASKRKGCSSTKGRSEVKHSGAKLWRQKGTGRARVGDSGSSIRRGGGVAFGPKPREYNKRVPKKVRKIALKMALTDKVSLDKMYVIKDFKDFTELKTKKFVALLDRFGVNQALVVTHEKEDILERAARNVPYAKLIRHEGLNVYDILRHDYLMIEQSVLDDIEEALG